MVGDDVLVLSGDRKTLSLLRETGTKFSEIAKRSLPATLQQLRMAEAQGTDTTRFAFVDGRGQLFTGSAGPRHIDISKALASGLDRRFAPAMHVGAGRMLVAYTKAVSESMHTYVLDTRREEEAAWDVTPEGHGASAPSFVRGDAAATLVMLDAHEGISPLLEVSIPSSGAPTPATVRTPVSQPYAPTELLAAQTPWGEVQVAYTAVGKLAATAIGRVPLKRADMPTALHPSRGYGQVHFDLALGKASAIFAMQVPIDANEGAKHRIEIVWTGPSDMSSPLVLDGEGASGPSLANAGSGHYWLSYVVGGRAVRRELACAN